MSARTKRKNRQKRRKRRLFAAIAVEIIASEEAERTPEQEELELMRDEEDRQRTHEKWQEAVQQSFATYNTKMRILAQRLQLITSIRQNMQHNKQ